MSPRARTELYRLGIDVTAAVTLLASLRGLASGPAPNPQLGAVLFLLAILALQFPMAVNLTHRISVASAVVFAVLLTFPTATAAALIGVASACSGLISMIRKYAADGQLPLSVAIPTVAFNASQTFLSATATGLVLAAAGVSARTLALRPGVAVGLLAAALTMYVSNLLLVLTAVAISSGRNPLLVFASQQRTVALQSAVLYLVGLIGALAATRSPLGLALMVVPAALGHRALSRRMRLNQSVIRRVEQTADEVDRRDPYTFQHSRRVAEYSVAIGRKLGLNVNQLAQLRLAATVHDIGKIAIPDSILLKPGRLTDQERLQMELHPRLGYDYLAEFAEYAQVRELVLTHHERYDGGGYPNGTQLIRLPLMARILPVADSLDAMTSDRPYRKALSWAHALGELERGAGTQWDAKVVDAAISCYRDRTRQVAPNQTLQPA